MARYIYVVRVFSAWEWRWVRQLSFNTELDAQNFANFVVWPLIMYSDEYFIVDIKKTITFR